MRLVLALSAALIATPAFAADPPDAPMATGSAATPPSVAQQIDDYLKSSPALEAKADDAVDGVVGRDERKVHGEVSVGVGTGGYRSVYGRADLPLGKSGRLSLAFEDTRHGRGYGYYDRPYYDGPGVLGIDRQRCDLEGMSPPRPLDSVRGPHGRCVGPLVGW